jgi:hypothetical protein
VSQENPFKQTTASRSAFVAFDATFAEINSYLVKDQVFRNQHTSDQLATMNNSVSRAKEAVGSLFTKEAPNYPRGFMLSAGWDFLAFQRYAQVGKGREIKVSYELVQQVQSATADLEIKAKTLEAIS